MIILLPLKQTPSPNYSSRGGQRVRLIVSHDCEGSYAGSISWFAQARSQVSAHIVLREDGGEATRMVAFANKAWHVCNANPFSEGIEAAGYAAKGLGAPEWHVLANLVAWRLHANGIPCQVASAANNWTGFCQHADLGAMGGAHHDITSDPAVWNHFINLVDGAYVDMAQNGMPSPNAPYAPVPAPPLNFTPHADPRHDLVFHSLEWVQASLNKLGYGRPPLIVDGMTGPATQAAVEAFQRHVGIAVDGDAGPDTWTMIERALSAP